MRIYLAQEVQQKRYPDALVVLLLFADLFVAMPTLTIMLLSGYFLGAPLGAAASIVGLILAGFIGYGLSQHYGQRIAY